MVDTAPHSVASSCCLACDPADARLVCDSRRAAVASKVFSDSLRSTADDDYDAASASKSRVISRDNAIYVRRELTSLHFERHSCCILIVPRRTSHDVYRHCRCGCCCCCEGHYRAKWRATELMRSASRTDSCRTALRLLKFLVWNERRSNESCFVDMNTVHA